MDHDPLEARRRFLQQFLLAGAALGSASLFAPVVHAFGRVPHELGEGRSFYDIRGKVLVDGQPANLKTRVHANSLVETGSNSYAIFVVGKDSHLLRENSRLQLSGDGFFEDAMRLITGKVLSVFGKRTGGRSYAINTNVATIGIRGTGVYLEAEPDHSYVCTCYGLVNLASATDPSAKEDIQSLHHDAPRYILANPEAGKLITPAPMKNHTDEELMLIEELVGRSPPFSSVKGYSAPRRGY